MPTEERFLAAILFTDIEGFSGFTHINQEKGLQMAQIHHFILQEKVKQYGGECINFYGDGSLSIFHSVRSALFCSLEVQKIFMDKSILPVRFGVHLGEVIRDQHSVYGDAVNVASRIESLAPVGSILISDEVKRAIGGTTDFKFTKMGVKSLKNISTQVTIFRVEPKHSSMLSGYTSPRISKSNNFIHRLYQSKRTVLNTFILIFIFSFVIQLNFGELGNSKGDTYLCSYPLVDSDNIENAFEL